MRTAGASDSALMIGGPSSLTRLGPESIFTVPMNAFYEVPYTPEAQTVKEQRLQAQVACQPWHKPDVLSPCLRVLSRLCALGIGGEIECLKGSDYALLRECEPLRVARILTEEGA